MRRVVVLGPRGRAVGRSVRHRRGPDALVAGFVGGDEQEARALGEEMLGGVDELVVLSGEEAGTEDEVDTGEEAGTGEAETPPAAPDA